MTPPMGHSDMELTSRQGLVLIIDNHGKIIWSSDAWVEFCKNKELAEEVWKAGLNYLTHAQERDETAGLVELRKVINKELETCQQIFPLPDNEGTSNWFSVKAKSIKIGRGKKDGAILFHEPVNLHTIEPISAESILESMTDGFYLLDSNFKVIYINEIAEERLQYKNEEATGRHLLEIFPELKGSNFHQKLTRALEDGNVIHFEEYYNPFDSWYNIKVHPLKKGGLAIYFQDITERKKTEEKMKEYAYYDFLTGLPNRRFLTQRAKLMTEQKKKFTIFYIDLDNLKFVNTLHNFHAGDKVIQMIAGKLIQLSSDKCFAGRLDSDEFAILYLPDKGERLEGFANMLKAVFEEPFDLDDSLSVTVHASIGIACSPYDTEDLEELSSYVETAMYEAKKTSGTSYSFFRPKMRDEQIRLVKMEEGLTGDFMETGFYYTVQPQIDGLTGELNGVEVLSRWNHPQLGEVSPVEFIAIAEQLGTIASLTYALIKEVFCTIKKWEKDYEWNTRTAINMTPTLLASSAFFEDFFRLMKYYEIRPELIEIEITEQAELTYSGRTLENLRRCQLEGIKIAIDDFGTGFSMIAYLTSFPIDKIKIDRYFIQKIGKDNKSEAVLKSLIQLAQSIECETLAEGVERPEEVSFLKAHHCNIFQGYFYDKPMKIDAFEEKYLRNRHRFCRTIEGEV